MGTAGDYGLTWDEPVYIGAARSLEAWFGGIGRLGLRESFRPERMSEGWVFARRENRNLPLSVLLSCAGRVLAGGLVSPLVSYRLGHCLLMATTVGALFLALARGPGLHAAWVGSGSLLLMPQAFAHAHIDATDAPASCLWILSTLCFLQSESSVGMGVLTAVLCGLGLATKATFVLLPLLFCSWILAFRRWAFWRAALLVVVAAPLVMLAACPMWWAAPYEQVAHFLGITFGHTEQIWTFDAYYLGKAYAGHPPWPSGVVLTAVSTPPWILGLALAGVVSAALLRNPAQGLWAMGAACLPLLRMVPGTPGHDGARLLLPSLFCLAPLAGFGFVALAEAKAKLPGRWSGLGAAVLLGLGLWEIASMHPFEMSYYSEVVGGLRGAERLGFEVTYWFDALTPSALGEIERRLPPGAAVWTFPRYRGYELLGEWGLWRRDLVKGRREGGYLILYSRKGTLAGAPAVRRIYEEDAPLWSLRCQGVQLVGLYRLPRHDGIEDEPPGGTPGSPP